MKQDLLAEGSFTTYFDGRVFFRIFTFYILFDDSTRVSDDRKYVCGRRLYACINRKALDNINLNQMSHRYVSSGVLQND